uniref:Ribosomal L1 domain-containing protein 1 n=1 Tax=Cacopsylla melanoneura TaxID=428564 RepID=A0A8D8QWH9_9HEMI
MKSVKVKKSPAILGLSKKSKDKLKNKKKPKDLSTSLRNVLAKHFSEDHSDSDPSVLKDNVKIVNKKPNQQGKSPKKGKQSMKQKKGKNKTDSLVKIETEDRKPVVLQKVDYIDSKKAIVAVQALLNHVKTQNKNILFKSEGTPIFAQFDTVAIPKHPKTTLRFVLPHSPHSKVSDVLLIITDEKKHHRKLRHDDEMYIVNFEEKLKELGVKGVNKVMTLRQIRAEYYTHEMRRKLSDMYDVFLVDGKIACKLSSLIGKCFYAKNKTPIPVSLENEDKVKLEVERALRKTQLVFKSSCCTNSVVRIGHTDMSPKELSENLEAFSKAVDTSKYPGGWRNVKKVHIKTPTSIALPVYFSFVTPNEIENAELKHTLPKHCVAVKGELSTIGRDVTVKPDGSIEVEGVDDIKSLMHQLYKHAGFKDHEDLDLTNAEYKELVKELRKNIPLKKEPEDPNEPTEADVEDLLDNEDDDDSNSIEGDIQREDNVHGDFEDEKNDDVDSEEEEEKGDSVEASYMKQWEETWMNEDKEEKEEEEEKGKKKGKKNTKPASAAAKNVTTKNRKQQGQNAAAAAKGGAAANKRKLNQAETSGEQSGKKQKKTKEAAPQTPQQKGNAAKNEKKKKNVDRTESETIKMNNKQDKGKKKQGNGEKGEEKNQKQGGKKGNAEKKVGQKENQGGKKVKTSSKKDTPLRQKGGAVVHESSSEAVVMKKKKGKKAGAPAPNYIPL